MRPIEERLVHNIRTLNEDFTLNEHQLEQLTTFYENLVEWNQVMNLTAITEEGDVYTKHFLDSLSILKVLDPNEFVRKTLIDVGTGAGFPGLVLAIAFPQLHVTLMDSLNKRINFLNDTIEKCGLTNVTCIHSRAEELGRNKEQREHYDYVVSRAVANTSTLSEYCLPLVKVGGSFIAYKAERLEEELPAGEKAIHILGGTITDKVSFSLPDSEYDRTLLVVYKASATNRKYPRKAGTPSKEPLGT